eukprot:GILK01005942.1.p1 GENE.GILK01005942.1~~GILK01005942.1.p1  ORF type:complete len:477 (-),score=50.95 GILK01005942.1:173-1540(-)
MANFQGFRPHLDTEEYEQRRREEARRRDRERRGWADDFLMSRAILVKNIPTNSTPEEITQLCSEFGGIKRTYGWNPNEQLMCIQFFDLRDADRARAALDGKEYKGERLQVAFCSHKDPHFEEDPDPNTGTLFVVVKNTRQHIGVEELERIFLPFGHIKKISENKRSPGQKFIEFFDTRQCEAAIAATNGMPVHEGYLDVRNARSPSINLPTQRVPRTDRPAFSHKGPGRFDEPPPGRHRPDDLGGGAGPMRRPRSRFDEGPYSRPQDSGFRDGRDRERDRDRPHREPFGGGKGPGSPSRGGPQHPVSMGMGVGGPRGEYPDPGNPYPLPVQQPLPQANPAAALGALNPTMLASLLQLAQLAQQAQQATQYAPLPVTAPTATPLMPQYGAGLDLNSALAQLMQPAVGNPLQMPPDAGYPSQYSTTPTNQNAASGAGSQESTLQLLASLSQMMQRPQ